MRIFCIPLSCLLLISVQCFADHITLKNGDHLTGTIVSSDGKTVSLKTDYAGELTIDWKQIQEMDSESAMHVETKTKQTYSGKVIMQNDSLHVQGTPAQTATIPRQEVTALADQNAYEESQHPGWIHAWDGGATVGFALTRGNSQTKNLNLAFDAKRTGARDRIILYSNAVYSTNDAAGAIPSTTANTVQGGARYERDLNTRLFAFAAADFMTDELQTLDLRSVLGGGLGYHVIKSDITTLDLLGGANYTRENYSLFTRNLAAATIGEEFSHKLRSTLLTQRLFFYPNISDGGDYRATFDFGTVTKLNKWFGWQNSFSDIYVSNPPLGKRQNDIIFTTGLNVSFSRHGGTSP